MASVHLDKHKGTDVIHIDYRTGFSSREEERDANFDKLLSFRDDLLAEKRQLNVLLDLRGLRINENIKPLLNRFQADVAKDVSALAILQSDHDLDMLTNIVMKVLGLSTQRFYGEAVDALDWLAAQK